MSCGVAVLVSVRVCVIAVIIVHCRIPILVGISPIEIAIHVMTGDVAVAVATNINEISVGCVVSYIGCQVNLLIIFHFVIIVGICDLFLIRIF